MSTYFISRHQGATQWLEQQGFHIDQLLSHFDPEIMQTGDIILGTLPINLVAKICDKGGQYFHLSLDIPPEYRGQELSLQQMQQFNARLQAFEAKELSKKPCPS